MPRAAKQANCSSLSRRKIASVLFIPAAIKTFTQLTIKRDSVSLSLEVFRTFPVPIRVSRSASQFFGLFRFQFECLAQPRSFSDFSGSNSSSGTCSGFSGFSSFRPRRLKCRKLVQKNWQLQVCLSAHEYGATKEESGWNIDRTLPCVCLPSIFVVSVGLSRITLT